MITKQDVLDALKGCKTQDERADAVLELIASDNCLPEVGQWTHFPTGIPGAAVQWEDVTPDHRIGRNCNGAIVEILIRE